MNLAVLIDGTGCSRGSGTNVERLADALARDSAQDFLYCAGSGTRKGSAFLGKVFGNDVGDIVLHCRRFLYERIRAAGRNASETKIFLFGFSRGAFAVRLLADFLSYDNLAAHPRDCASRWRRYAIASAAGVRPAATLSSDPPAISYMGLWDTVDSTPAFKSSPLETLPSNVGRVRHAVAIHEYRRLFDYIPFRPDPRVEEIFFPGAHSDIGGGYPDNREIADLALSWIAEGAAESGLRFSGVVPGKHAFDPSRAKIHDSRFEASNAFGALEGRRRNIDPARVHPSAAFFPPPQG